LREENIKNYKKNFLELRIMKQHSKLTVTMRSISSPMLCLFSLRISIVVGQEQNSEGEIVDNYLNVSRTMIRPLL
jgi:hypothetical protein